MYVICSHQSNWIVLSVPGPIANDSSMNESLGTENMIGCFLPSWE